MTRFMRVASKYEGTAGKTYHSARLEKSAHLGDGRSIVNRSAVIGHETKSLYLTYFFIIQIIVVVRDSYYEG